MTIGSIMRKSIVTALRNYPMENNPQSNPCTRCDGSGKIPVNGNGVYVDHERKCSICHGKGTVQPKLAPLPPAMPAGKHEVTGITATPDTTDTVQDQTFGGKGVSRIIDNLSTPDITGPNGEIYRYADKVEPADTLEEILLTSQAQYLGIKLTNIEIREQAKAKIEAYIDTQIANQLGEELRATRDVMNTDGWPKHPRLSDWLETRIKEVEEPK